MALEPVLGPFAQAFFGPLNRTSEAGAIWAQNRQDGAHVQKITNGGCSLYVPV